jgi:hypothetical protein
MQPSACPPWQPDHAANAAQELRSYTTRWDTIEDWIRRIDQGEKLRPQKLLEDASIDPITAAILERVGLLGHDLPARFIAFMFVLTSIRIDLVRFGKSEFDDNMQTLANIFREDLALWAEHEPKARMLVKDLRNHSNERFRLWSRW